MDERLQQHHSQYVPPERSSTGEQLLQFYVLITFIVACSFDFLARMRVIPREMTLLPELLSAGLILIVAMRIAVHKTFSINTKYVLLITLLAIHVLAGAVVNDLDPATMFVGMRIYLKYIPFFFLPIVFPFKPHHLKFHMGAVMVILLAQAPITVLQRFFLYQYTQTGDVVRGTFSTGSMLSIVIMCTIGTLFAFFLKKRLSLRRFIALTGVLMIPPMLNETKGSLILLPIALMVPAIMFSDAKARLKNVVLSGTIILVAGAGLGVMYNVIQTSVGGNVQNIFEFFTDPKRVLHYLAPQAGGFEAADHYGRFDKLILPFQELSEDPVKMVTGLGIGSMTKSAIDDLLGVESRHQDLHERGVLGHAAAYLLWETGALGFFLMIWIWFTLFRDARWLSKEDSMYGALALGWTAAIAVLVMALPYKHYIGTNSIMYLFAFFSGHVVAAAHRARAAAQSEARELNSPLVQPDFYRRRFENPPPDKNPDPDSAASTGLTRRWLTP